jgi:hypothetical protein
MKILLASIYLITLFLAGQYISGQDKIITSDGKTTECKIIGISNEKVDIMVRVKDNKVNTYILTDNITSIELRSTDSLIFAPGLSAANKAKVIFKEMDMKGKSSMGIGVLGALVPGTGYYIIGVGTPLRFIGETAAFNVDGYYAFFKSTENDKSIGAFSIIAGPDYLYSKQKLGNGLQIKGFGGRVGYAFLGEFTSYWMFNMAFTSETFKTKDLSSSTMFEFGLGLAYRPGGSETKTENYSYDTGYSHVSGSSTTTTTYEPLKFPYIYIKLRMSLSTF